MKALAGLLAAVALASCATPPPATIRNPCLPLKVYSTDQQIAMAQALAALPADSPLVLLIQDYGAMRDADRACQASAK